MLLSMKRERVFMMTLLFLFICFSHVRHGSSSEEGLRGCGNLSDDEIYCVKFGEMERLW